MQRVDRELALFCRKGEQRGARVLGLGDRVVGESYKADASIQSPPERHPKNDIILLAVYHTTYLSQSLYSKQ